MLIVLWLVVVAFSDYVRVDFDVGHNFFELFNNFVTGQRFGFLFK